MFVESARSNPVVSWVSFTDVSSSLSDWAQSSSGTGTNIFAIFIGITAPGLNGINKNVLTYLKTYISLKLERSKLTSPQVKKLKKRILYLNTL